MVRNLQRAQPARRGEQEPRGILAAMPLGKLPFAIFADVVYATEDLNAFRRVELLPLARRVSLAMPPLLL